MNKAKAATAIQVLVILLLSYVTGAMFYSPAEPHHPMVLVMGFVYLIGLTVLSFVFYLLVFTLHKFNKKNLEKRSK